MPLLCARRVVIQDNSVSLLSIIADIEASDWELYRKAAATGSAPTEKEIEDSLPKGFSQEKQHPGDVHWGEDSNPSSEDEYGKYKSKEDPYRE